MREGRGQVPCMTSGGKRAGRQGERGGKGEGGPSRPTLSQNRGRKTSISERSTREKGKEGDTHSFKSPQIRSRKTVIKKPGRDILSRRLNHTKKGEKIFFSTVASRKGGASYSRKGGFPYPEKRGSLSHPD